MQQIIINLSDEQHLKMMEHLRKSTQLNLEEETISGYEIKLNCVDGGFFSWIEIFSNSSLDLGEVNWKMKEIKICK